MKIIKYLEVIQSCLLNILSCILLLICIPILIVLELLGILNNEKSYK